MKLEFSRQTFEKSSNFMKTCQLRVELFREDGRTDMKKLIVAFRNFADARNKELLWNP